MHTITQARQSRHSGSPRSGLSGIHSPDSLGQDKIAPVVSMDSGLALRAPRNDGAIVAATMTQKF
jgi:hypothetical protein